MSDDLAKALNTALSRIASLEAQAAGARPKRNDEPSVSLSALIADPVGAMTRAGVPVEHITKVLVANAMGDQAPPELRMLASMGPQVTAQRALDEKVEALSRQLSALTSPKPPTAESVKALTSDKSKYPHLARALAADPSFFSDDELAAGGSAEEFAARAEARLSKMATVFAPPAASDANADHADQSTQVKPADSPATAGGVPPIPKPVVGAFTPEDHAKLRDEIVRKANSQAAQG
jgi:hypothetical protein